jgi:hypothetical protein
MNNLKLTLGFIGILLVTLFRWIIIAGVIMVGIWLAGMILCGLMAVIQTIGG